MIVLSIRPLEYSFGYVYSVQAAASCYIELIVKESDNNVKLIVLDRLMALKEVPAHEKILQVNTLNTYLIG